MRYIIVVLLLLALAGCAEPGIHTGTVINISVRDGSTSQLYFNTDECYDTAVEGEQ
jgi:hypothetical protein